MAKRNFWTIDTTFENSAFETEMEFADCFILLFGADHSYGMSYEDIKECINAKMHVNKMRSWGQPDKNGVVNHIKD